MHRKTLARNCLPPASPNCPAPNSIAPAPRSDPETPPPSRPESPAPAAPPQPPQPSPVESHSKSSFLAPDHPPHPSTASHPPTASQPPPPPNAGAPVPVVAPHSCCATKSLDPELYPEESR